jgi:hypothetical protein
MARRLDRARKAAPTAIAAPAPAAAGTRAILSPTLDFLCVGGIGICALAAIALSPRDLASYAYWPATILGLQILFNFPHFIASYRLLYQSKEIVYRYKWASIYLPIVLGSYLLFSLVHPVVFREPVNDKYWHLADLISGMYLAAHYAGQTWGMVASFAYLGAVQIQKIERHALRTVLLVFMAWHVAIANHLVPKYTLFVPELKPFLDNLFDVITPLAHVAMVVAIAVFVRMGYRTGRVPPLSALVPIPLLYFGYLVFTRGHAGLLLLQVCHALQYLIFPLRVEINRYNGEERHAERNHVVLYALALIAAGAFVFLGPDVLPGKTLPFGATILLALINIHHFFIDGCVWKISTPEVKKDLFRHLAREKAPQEADRHAAHV